MRNILLFEFLAEVPCAPFSMFGGPGGTEYDGVRFPVHGGWDITDDSVAGVCDCFKDSVSFLMLLNI